MMICVRCHGTGMVRELADELPIGAAAAARLARPRLRGLSSTRVAPRASAQPEGTSAIADPV